MGTNSSKHNSVKLALDKPAYHGGETVHATVALNLVEPLDVAGISVRVRAVEKTCWATTYSGGWGQVKQARSIDRGGTATLAHVAEELPGATGQQLTVGRYQWNVTIQLPTSAPSTFEQDWGDAGAYLSYETSVVVHRAGAEHKHPALYAREFIAVHQRQQELPGAEHSEELELGKDGGTLSTLKPHGTILASLRLAQGHCLPGGHVDVALALDNRSTVPVKSVEVGLERDILLREEPGCVASQHGFRELCSKHATAEGVPAGSAVDRRLQVMVPPELAAQPSLHGGLIWCDYFLRATLKTGLLAEDVHIKIPVQVQPAHGANCSNSDRQAALPQPSTDQKLTRVFPPVALALPELAIS